MFFFYNVAYIGNRKWAPYIPFNGLFPHKEIKKARDYMLALSYNQKAILNLYKRFYLEGYPSGIASDHTATQTHINSQKMFYLLKMYGVNVGDFCFSWNYHGPFSPGLLATLRSLDLQKHNIEDYYSNSDSSDNEMLFSDDNNKIEKLIDLLELKHHLENLSNWMELLGSLVYISNSVFPYEDYTLVVRELKNRKDKFFCEEENANAWHVLEKAKLLKIPSSSL